MANSGSVKACAHLPQNANSSGFEKPHFGQMLSSLAAHFPQNCIPSGLSNPHFGHFIIDTSWKDLFNESNELIQAM
jgi:hypothetical protein